MRGGWDGSPRGVLWLFLVSALAFCVLELKLRLSRPRDYARHLRRRAGLVSPSALAEGNARCAPCPAGVADAFSGGRRSEPLSALPRPPPRHNPAHATAAPAAGPTEHNGDPRRPSATAATRSDAAAAGGARAHRRAGRAAGLGVAEPQPEPRPGRVRRRALVTDRRDSGRPTFTKRQVDARRAGLLRSPHPGLSGRSGAGLRRWDYFESLFIKAPPLRAHAHHEEVRRGDARQVHLLEDRCVRTGRRRQLATLREHVRAGRGDELRRRGVLRHAGQSAPGRRPARRKGGAGRAER